MKIEKYIHPNCSEYTIHLCDLSPRRVKRIKELENDLNDLYEWSKKERLTLPPEPNFLEPDPKKWGETWDTWKNLKEVKKFHKHDKKRWNKLRKKYRVKNEDIFDTTIRGFKWIEEDAVDINGYLNEGVLFFTSSYNSAGVNTRFL